MREMKDSELDTIGIVPTDWTMIRLKYLCKIQTGNEDTQNANPDGQYPFYVRSPIVEHCDRYTFDGEGILVAGDGAGAGRIFHHVYGKSGGGQKPSLNVFYQLVTLLEISVDQFFFPDKLNGESTCRKQIDVMLNSMDEKELTVMKYTAEGLQKARETEDA